MPDASSSSSPSTTIIITIITNTTTTIINGMIRCVRLHRKRHHHFPQTIFIERSHRNLIPDAANFDFLAVCEGESPCEGEPSGEVEKSEEGGGMPFVEDGGDGDCWCEVFYFLVVVVDVRG